VKGVLPQLRSGLTRGLAGAIGLFALANLLGGLARPGFDANIWWIDLRPLPAAVSHALIACAGVLLLLHALRPAVAGPRRRATAVAAGTFALIATANAVTYYGLLLDGTLHAGPIIPLSLPLAAALAWVAWRPDVTRGWRTAGAGLATCGAVALVGALGLMWTFGNADYRRPADAVVVFGCRAYADGRPSDALADRVHTAVKLYHAGYADTLVLSGGPGDGAFHETDVMARMARDAGVPAHAILIDRQGLNTAHTAANTAPLFAQHGISRVLAVSHGYHLPRVKLAYHRAGFEVYTVPAQERYTLTQLPYNMAREVAAWWVYYARPLTRG